jgi:hypothetical protein
VPKHQNKINRRYLHLIPRYCSICSKCLPATQWACALFKNKLFLTGLLAFPCLYYFRKPFFELKKQTSTVYKKWLEKAFAAYFGVANFDLTKTS